MSLAPLSVSIEHRERNPYRSLYAEMLFQSFRDALAQATTEASTAIQEITDRSTPTEEGERTGREAKRRTTEAQLPERDGLRR